MRCSEHQIALMLRGSQSSRNSSLRSIWLIRYTAAAVITKSQLRVSAGFAPGFLLIYYKAVRIK